MSSTGATWELVLIVLVFVLLAALFALRLWAALSTASADEPTGARSNSSPTSKRGSGSMAERRPMRYSRSAPSVGASADSGTGVGGNGDGGPARHDLPAEMRSELGFDSDSDFDPQSVPSDVLLESLSDEDRVLRMLIANDGRLRQQVIVERTDWSKSKVSRLLSTMHDRGSIEKISVGRENVITFPSDDSADEPLEGTR